MRYNRAHPHACDFKKAFLSTAQIYCQEHADPETAEPVAQATLTSVGPGEGCGQCTPGAELVGNIWEFLTNRSFILIDFRDKQVQSVIEEFKLSLRWRVHVISSALDLLSKRLST